MSAAIKSKAIAVESGIPLPNKGHVGAAPKYPWAEMKVGDSFFVKGTTTRAFSAQVARRARMDGHKYSVRTVDGGVRVWRIA